MAISTPKSFTSYVSKAFEGSFNNTTDVFKWVLVTDSFTATDADVVDAKLADFTQVASAGNYVANTTIANTSSTTTANEVVLTGDSWSYAADGANPTTGKSILIYNDTSASKSAVVIVDITVDNGVTPANTSQGLTYNVNAGGIFKATRTV